MKSNIEYFKVSGIYKILNLTNNKCYIGSSIDLYSRWNKHISMLNKGIHHSPYLQASFNKHGLNNFKIILLETCHKDILVSREQYYLDTIKPEYNILKIAYSTSGRIVSESTRLKLSLLKKNIPRSKEASLKTSLTHKKLGLKPTEECLKKAREAVKKKVINIETGQVFNSLKEASQFYNICNKQLSNKLLGKKKNNTKLKYL